MGAQHGLVAATNTTCHCICPSKLSFQRLNPQVLSLDRKELTSYSGFLTSNAAFRPRAAFITWCFWTLTSRVWGGCQANTLLALKSG